MEEYLNFMNNNKETKLKDLENQEFDLIIIGGGATGLGIAVDAITRGYKAILIEKFDYAKGTSSRSTKLIHGGVRYLAQGNIALVKEALHEKGILEKNAPHLINECAIITPIYNALEIPYYYFGLSYYHSLMSKGKSTKYKTKLLSKKSTIEKAPNIKTQSLKCSVLYYDDSFDDARMAITLLRTFTEKGGIALNYTELKKFNKENGKLSGILIQNKLTKEEISLKSKCIINATGIFSDEIRKLDDENASNIIKPSQGSHLIIKKDKFPPNHAILIPKTSDNRILFAIPWYGSVVCGSTDIPIKEAEEEPKRFDKEIEFIISNLNNYLNIKIEKSDIKSVYTGIRPLVMDPKAMGNTSKISRTEKIFISDSNLITIAGGKYTTYRKMAEKTLFKAIEKNLIRNCAPTTEDLKLHGYLTKEEAMKIPEPFRTYGSDFEILKNMEGFDKKIHENLDLNEAQIAFAIEFEQAKTIDDVLARRTRSLLLNPQATIEAAPRVAEIMMKQLNKSEKWKNEQIKNFLEISEKYLIKN
ncbi:FAD-dependent oxidoreductase [Borrelia sp. CA_690]|uniref:Glycerol-3-phosphate dehydrogenase/oxidase n=1 Tax=Borrelia maritima TaxID=2761123 RepID=A0A5J6WEI5_9SPIR|nr:MULTISPECIES: glycerol-3-phosphate dehydrogenase/oxidase [Borrelia]QFI14379.1 glycerol-3-phosphate dehydrogenase/oxidase [Borrelia maritima]WKC84235.1 glycerol-3-phosphate dehydrogenase/oxidase [Borrelia sp. CA_690]